MNKAVITALVPIVAMTVALVGCTIKPAVPQAPVSMQPGVFGLEVGNSLYPKSRGASIGFQRYLGSGEEVAGSLEWSDDYAVYYKWSLYIYAPDGSIVLEWSGRDLKHQFHFTATKPGTYRLEILKRDFARRGAQLITDPPDWNRWGG